jgi:hypothetical protein
MLVFGVQHWSKIVFLGFVPRLFLDRFLYRIFDVWDFLFCFRLKGIAKIDFSWKQCFSEFRDGFVLFS